MGNLINLFFKEITIKTRPEEGFLARFIAVHKGNVKPEVRQQNLVECFGLAHARWSLLLKQGLGIEVNANLQSNLILVAMLGGPKFDSLPTFREQIKMVSGITELGEFESSIENIRATPMYEIKEFKPFINPKEMSKFERLSIALANFLRNDDIYFLASLILLLKDDEAHLSWHHSLKRLLFKRLNDYCGNAQIDVGKIFDDFVNDFNGYVMVQRKVTRVIEENSRQMMVAM